MANPRKKDVVLTADDCVEIHAALAIRREHLREDARKYPVDPNDDFALDYSKWADHLDTIMEKLGPDAQRLVGK